ncbi:hypothetical protein Pgy4_36879, partial [Pseudomonas savastanoi pv. glycinea str. race 4]
TDAPVLNQPPLAEAEPEQSNETLNQLRGLLNNRHRERPTQALLPTWMIRRGRHHLRDRPRNV